jgi:transposase
VLWYKRLEKHRFPWLRGAGAESERLTGRELNWLLDGIDIFAMRPHETLSFESVL